MPVILGVDPGSRLTGFGLVRAQGARIEYLASGCIRLSAAEPLARRLQRIFEDLGTVIDAHGPTELAIEQVFLAKSADSALKLGQARGAALVAAAVRGLAVHEYSPSSIKQAVVGSGSAEKRQVQHMVKTLLGLAAVPQADAADALAAALCHAHTSTSLARVPAARGGRRGGRRWSAAEVGRR